ncbi:hypothetical protein [Paraburkholderia sp.]|jgi:hypothetical protein|uniref:hypothetical protein n=1 Tax=Paraburkholderia sp. TaxID=1926495 RepID=UPI002F3FC663
MTVVLPLSFAALAMIAQRKPKQDKGFEELRGCLPELFGKLPFLSLPDSNSPSNQGFTGGWRWFLPTFAARISP